ncbi:hypothetical protein V6N13_066597 [Hibiscus sabdariffa]
MLDPKAPVPSILKWPLYVSLDGDLPQLQPYLVCYCNNAAAIIMDEEHVLMLMKKNLVLTTEEIRRNFALAMAGQDTKGFGMDESSSSQAWIKAGYWASSADLPISDIKSDLFTHLFCAFAFLNSTSYQLLINSSNEPSFSNFTNIVKLKNPSITTLLSIWVGRTESTTFFLMINQTSHRKSFVESSIKIARLYGFHGLDLYGVEPRNGTNMTSLAALLDEWRAEVVAESRNSGKTRLLLTMSARILPIVNSESYPFDSANRSLDWVSIVAYDYHVPILDRFTGFHAALYDPLGRANTDARIREWLKRGFPAEKLVLGLPYHGYAWKLVNSGDNGVGSAASGPATTIDGSMAYWFIKSFIRNAGYGVEPVYNSTSVVNILKIGLSWINFDDVEAIKAKVSYAKEKGLRGYIAFQLSNDDNWLLSQAAYEIGTSQQKKHQSLVIVPVTVAAFFLLMMAIICYLQKKIFKPQGLLSVARMPVSWIRTKISAETKHEDSDPNLQNFSFSSIKAATNNFSNANKLGEGGYGPVYKGKLPKGQEIAVKRLSKSSNQDFGIAKFFKKEEPEANTGRIIGTYGYVPPEYVKKGIYSTKYDVYSFGVLLLQIISGKRNSSLYGCHENLNLLEYAYELWKQGRGAEFFDTSLDDSSSSCKLIRCMQVALLCVQENAADRPSMVEVFSILKNGSSAISTPKRPAYSVAKDENKESTDTERREVFSVNDASITQVVPR